MHGMADAKAAPNPIQARDVEAVIGLLAVLAGEGMLDQIEPALGQLLTDRLIRAGLLPSDAGLSHLSPALDDLTQRLHQALGAYDPPVQDAPAP